MTAALPPKYRKVAERVEEIDAQIPSGEPGAIGLRIVVEANATRAEIRAAQKQAIAKHLAAHPEDRGREVDPWIIWQIVHPDPALVAAREAAASLPERPPAREPPRAEPPRPTAADDDFFSGAARVLEPNERLP